jgi:hypothetical protein
MAKGKNMTPYIPPALMARVKKVASTQGLSMSVFITSAIADRLADLDATKKLMATAESRAQQERVEL